jgi:YggT family protein
MNAGSYLANAGEYIITLVFELYILAVMLRFLLQLVRADFYNPISQFLITVTNPVLRHLRRWIPGYAGIDWPSILLMLILQSVELSLIALVKIGTVPSLLGLVFLAPTHLLKMIIWIYIILIILQALISWINPGAYSPVTVLMYQLTDPVLRPVRRTFPPAGGLDWTPFIVLIVLNLLLILLIAPLQDYGNFLSGYTLRII